MAKKPATPARPQTAQARTQVATTRAPAQVARPITQPARPQTAQARTQVAATRAPQTAGQRANLAKIQQEAAARRAAQRPGTAAYSEPQGRDAQGQPIRVPGQMTAPTPALGQTQQAAAAPGVSAFQSMYDSYANANLDPSQVKLIPGKPPGVSAFQNMYDSYANANLDPSQVKLIPAPAAVQQQLRPTASSPVSGDFNLDNARYNQPIVEQQANQLGQDLMNQYASVLSGTPASAYTPNFNPQQQQQMQAQTDFFAQTQPGATGIYGSTGESALQTGQAGLSSAAQNLQNMGQASQTPQGMYDQYANNIFGTPASAYTPNFGASGNQPNGLGAGNQPMQSYAQLLSGNSPNAGLNPQFNTNSSQPTGQLPGNAGNFGQQQQTTQQANPAQPANSGKMGGTGGPMGPINTSAL